MPSADDVLTTLSSSLIRVSAYVFLRWIPTTIVPKVLPGFLLVYIVSFYRSFLTTAPYKIISDEITILEEELIHPSETLQEILREEARKEDAAAVAKAVDNGEPVVLLDVEEDIEVEPKGPEIVKTLFSGLPSPTSGFWSWITFAINIALALMVADHIYRAPLLHSARDLSFVRVGYVSSTGAKLVLREPLLERLPVFIYYRLADTPLDTKSTNLPYAGHSAYDSAWKHVSTIYHLTNETDYTAEVTLRQLTPDTRYQWAINNKTGYFITAPKSGEFSKRYDGKYTFLHSSCIKPRVPYNPLDHPLHFPGFKHLANWIPKLQAHFMLFLGDFIYVDVPTRHGGDVETYRREYRQVYASPDWPSVSEDLPWIHVIDDHEIGNDWDRNTTGVYQSAIDPWHHYQAVANPPAIQQGETYFSFVQGPAMFFLMDTRRYRSSEFEKDTWDASKTMLGEHQLNDLLQFLRTPAPAGVRWKFVVSSIPFTKNWRFGSEDTWAGYLAERQIILEAMWDVGASSSVGVVVLSGDRHEFAATKFPPPKDGRWPNDAAVHEFSTSPLSMFYLPKRTYDQRDDDDVCVKYLPDGNFKFGALEITSPETSEQSFVKYKLFIEGEEAWSYIVSTPDVKWKKRATEAIWG